MPLLGPGCHRLLCVAGTYASIISSAQPTGILWDPTLSTNEAAADQALNSKRAAAAGSDDSDGISTGALVGIIVGGVVFLVLVVVVVVMKVKGGKNEGKVQPT